MRRLSSLLGRSTGSRPWHAFTSAPRLQAERVVVHLIARDDAAAMPRATWGGPWTRFRTSRGSGLLASRQLKIDPQRAVAAVRRRDAVPLPRERRQSPPVEHLLSSGPSPGEDYQCNRTSHGRRRPTTPPEQMKPSMRTLATCSLRYASPGRAWRAVGRRQNGRIDPAILIGCMRRAADFWQCGAGMHRQVSAGAGPRSLHAMLRMGLASGHRSSRLRQRTRSGPGSDIAQSKN
jgi:hypothetical protein